MAKSQTVTSPMKGAERISRSLGVYAGKVSITSYTVGAVICTAITRHFIPTSSVAFQKGVVSCQIDGPSSGGYIVTWDATVGGFKAFTPTTIQMDSGVGTGATALVLTGQTAVMHATSCVGTIIGTAGEAPENVTIGTFGFVAVGFIHA